MAKQEQDKFRTGNDSPTWRCDKPHAQRAAKASLRDEWQASGQHPVFGFAPPPPTKSMPSLNSVTYLQHTENFGLSQPAREAKVWLRYDQMVA
jgi:hypothetical protein